MTGHHFVIIFIKDRAYLTPDRPLTLAEAGLPEIAKSFAASAFWSVRVIKHIESEQRLHCEILSYQVGQTDFSGNQKLLFGELNNVKTVSYRTVDTGGLLRTLKSTAPVSILPVKETPVVRPEPRQEVRDFTRKVTVTFSVPIKDVQFKAGGVMVKRKFNEYAKPVELNIGNPDIIEEYDAIKNYFANVLNAKKIQVTATIEIEDNELKSAKATSPEISRIDKQLIEDVRLNFLKATKKKAPTETGQSLFTMEEYLETFGEHNFNADAFYSNESELLEDLLKITNTKHYKHLRYLSSKHRYQAMKLRFIHKPFSFMFLLEGVGHDHLVWETLDTEEATYIWCINKNSEALKKALLRIDRIITDIGVHGKTVYLQSEDDTFRRVYHDYSEGSDGFKTWKGELDAGLI